MLRFSRRDFLSGLLGSASLSAVGCGTVLHPERRGQPAGPLDWKIVALDTIGLIFFFVPGVIAFAVDFMTGAIYLPPGEYGSRQSKHRPQKLMVIDAAGKRLTPQNIERIVSEQTGRPIHLQPGRYTTRRLDDIKQFWAAEDQLIAQLDDRATGDWDDVVVRANSDE